MTADEEKNKRGQREIWYYDKGIYKKEKIAAEKWMRLIYENPIGSAALPIIIKRKALSRLYGAYCRTKHSAKMVPRFIEENNIDMTGCRDSYKSFADFFSREKSGITFPEEAGVLGSPCEGMASAYADIEPENMIAAKGSSFSLPELLGDSVLADEFRGGTMLQIRLTPANYHRMHFFDSGKVTGTKFINGDLYSVSPLAVRRIASLYCRNKRAVILFSSQNFGKVAITEVGATFVGSIVHCFSENENVNRGGLTSYFLPGGSLVLFFFTKGMFLPNDELINQTNMGFETKVNVGDIL